MDVSDLCVKDTLHHGLTCPLFALYTAPWRPLLETYCVLHLLWIYRQIKFHITKIRFFIFSLFFWTSIICSDHYS